MLLLTFTAPLVFVATNFAFTLNGSVDVGPLIFPVTEVKVTVFAETVLLGADCVMLPVPLAVRVTDVAVD